MGSKGFRISAIFTSLLSFCAPSTSHALVGTLIDTKTLDPKAIGSVGLDSSSFMYRSSARGTAATTFQASIVGGFESSLLTGVGSAQFFTFVEPNPQIGFEAPELYLSTRPRLLDGHDITIGRKKVAWSKVDGAFQNMMSLWSPRFTWDQVYPETIGMTGLFYTYQTSRFKFTAFGSPIAVPERGTPISEENKNITSPNPFWNPLPTELPVLGVNKRIEYSLSMPDLQEILLRPNFALRGEYHFESGLWISANTGVLPVHMTQLAAEPFLAPGASTDALQVNIRPQFPMRNINTIEFGYDDPADTWSAWISASYEQPFNFENQRNWLNPIITPTSVVSVGTDFKVTQNFYFDGALLFVREQPFIRSSSLPEINVDLPSRFPLKQGIKAAGHWILSDVNDAHATWVQDLVNPAHFVSLSFQHKIRSLKLSVGGGMDLMLATSNKGWVGQFYGDDRLRGWLKYAF
jgi:hypothetical protein